MHKVYEAENYIDAQIARAWLQDAGLQVHLAGEHLGGAVGELPAFGLQSLWVNADDVARAMDVLAELAQQRSESEALDAQEMTEADDVRDPPLGDSSVMA